MLEFFSASTRMANPQRAIQECLEVAVAEASHDCDLILLNASIGHSLPNLVAEVRKQCPQARIVASSCAGVVGREGVYESLKDVALMAVKGKEFAVAHVDQIYGHNSYVQAKVMAQQLYAANPAINMIYLLASGIDIDNNAIITAFTEVFGADIPLFGATSSDNMRGIASFQAVDLTVFEHAAFAVGFADPSLEVHTQATHGFVATGEPLLVTAATGNVIERLNGRPAWQEYLAHLGLNPSSATLADTIPIGAMAEALPPEQAAEYGNSHILRVITHVTEEGGLVYPVACAPGTPLWLTFRDEERIFQDLDRMIALMEHAAAGRKPVAVFQADCLARGRRLFNRIMKEELVQRMQHPFATNGEAPPWLGIYGFGEFAHLCGTNTFHNYTTALAAIYRKV